MAWGGGWRDRLLLANVRALFLESSFLLRHLINSYSYFRINLTYQVLCEVFMPPAPHPCPAKEEDPLLCGSITTST